MVDTGHRSRLREALGAIPKNSGVWCGLFLVFVFVKVSGRDSKTNIN